MKKLVFAAVSFLMFLPVFAQTVCGPYSPFGRAQNPDGTWTVGTYASCQIPDPVNWSHTYLVVFPSTITYLNGVTLQFVGSAVAYVDGHDDRVGRGPRRLVTVDSASFTDPQGNSYPVVKSEVGSYIYPVDQWNTTTPLSPDITYAFEVSGTDTVINQTQDTLHIQAIYQQVQNPVPPSGDGVVISE